MLTKALKARQTRLQDEKGFTLIELLAVIVILGIIAVIAIPLIGNIINKSKDDGDVATARQIYDAARLYVIGEKNGDFSADSEITLAELQDRNYIEGTVVLPSTKEVLVGATTIVTFTGAGELSGVTLTPPTAANTKTYDPEDVLGVEPAPPANP